MALEKQLTEAMAKSGHFSQSCRIKMDVQNLNGEQRIILHGIASTWYLKQMAYQVARRVAGQEIEIEDQIAVP